MSNSEEHNHRITVASVVVRIVFAFVFIVNIVCAISFIVSPESYVASFELEGTPGIIAVQGLGIVFLMWNATYPAVIVSPRRFRALAIVVIVQQIIGLVGELGLIFSLSSEHDLLIGSLMRFTIFDAIGLVLMVAAIIWYVISERRIHKQKAASVQE